MFSFRLWFIGAASCLLVQTVVLAANPFAPAPIPEGLGVNIHFTDPKSGEMEMIRAGGFRWLRMDLRWAETEKAAGTYDFSACDVLAAAAEKNGLKLYLILDYWNPLYDGGLAPHTEEGRQAFAKWAVAAGRHFAGQGIIWEIWNEPNLTNFWKPAANPPDYIKLALAASRAIRNNSPGETIIGPAASGMDLPFLEACFQAGLLQYWDAVSVHPYRQTAPETAPWDLDDLRVLIARYAPAGKDIPVLSGEWGYSASWKGYDEAAQAKMLPRQWLTNLAQGIPVSIWYDWRDDGTDPVDPEHHFGTVENAYLGGQSPVYKPKPAYLAAQKLTTELAGLSFNKRLLLDDAGQDYLLLFSSPDHQKIKLAAWTTGSPHAITLPFSPGEFLVGKDMTVGPQIALTDTPVYLTPLAPNPLLQKAVEWESFPSSEIMRNVPASIRGQTRIGALRTLEAGEGILWRQRTMSLIYDPLLATIIPSSARQLTVAVANPAGKPLKADVRLEIPGLPAAPSASLEFAAGQREASVKIEFPDELPLKSKANLTLLHTGTAEEILNTSGGYDATLSRDLGPAVWNTTIEGDPAALGKLSPSIAGAAEPPPALAGPVLKLDYNFDPGWKYIAMQQAPGAPLPGLEGHANHLTYWLYGDGKGLLPVARVGDASGEIFQTPAQKVDWTGWKQVTLRLDDPTVFHWGGDENGVLNYPLKLVSPLLLDHIDRGNSVSGTLYFTAPIVTWEE